MLRVLVSLCFAIAAANKCEIGTMDSRTCVSTFNGCIMPYDRCAVDCKFAKDATGNCVKGLDRDTVTLEYRGAIPKKVK